MARGSGPAFRVPSEERPRSPGSCRAPRSRRGSRRRVRARRGYKRPAAGRGGGSAGPGPTDATPRAAPSPPGLCWLVLK